MTYKEAVKVLGDGPATWLWRQVRIVDCIQEVRTLEADCRAKGALSRAEAYSAVAQAMEEAQKKH